MKKKILFLAPYPTLLNSKDGMISRVKAIDVLFDKEPRVYLDVSLKKNWKKDVFTDGIVEVYSLNLLAHFWIIFRMMYSFSHIYFHSIYCLRFLWIFILKNDTNFTLDIHGVVPEEQKYLGQSILKTKYYGWLENLIFRRLNNAVCVTDTMSNYYKTKYPNFKGKYITYSIVPENLNTVEDEVVNKLKNRNKDKIEVIYSGGIQGWQNIDLMLETIKRNQSSKIHYTILTGDKELFDEKIKETNINVEFITVISRAPSDLWKEYLVADYAFILRNNDIVNKVACPTKLIEYLYYGLTPIVLSPEIGDYMELGYDYILVDDFNDNFIKKRDFNFNNMNIAQDLINKNKTVNLIDFIYSN